MAKKKTAAKKSAKKSAKKGHIKTLEGRVGDLERRLDKLAASHITLRERVSNKKASKKKKSKKSKKRKS